MKIPLIQKQLKTTPLNALSGALCLGLAVCPAAQADQTTLGVQLRILPHIDAQLIQPPPLTSSLQDNQLCITHTKQILYSIETHTPFPQRELSPSNSPSKSIGYDFIQALHTRSRIESPEEINNHKADLSHFINKTACTKISTLMGATDSLSDANNSFADDRPPQVITVTIYAE